MIKLITAAGMLLTFAIGCGANKMTPTDETNLATLSARENACIVAHTGDKPSIDSCRAQAKADFEAKEQALYPDGGFEQDGSK